MTLDLVRLTDSPTYRSLCDAASTDPSAVLALVDWLQDQGAGLADLLVLYAGSPPEHVDGLPQKVLVAWCKATESTRIDYPPAEDDRGRLVVYRWRAVQAVSLDMYQVIQHLQGREDINRWGHEAIAADVANQSEKFWFWDQLCYQCSVVWHQGPEEREEAGEEIEAEVYAAVARARRWLKRRVLELFPEVVVMVVVGHEVRGLRGTERFSEIHAPDLITSEPTPP